MSTEPPPDRRLQITVLNGEGKYALIGSANFHTDSFGRNLYRTMISPPENPGVLAFSSHATGRTHTKIMWPPSKAKQYFDKKDSAPLSELKAPMALGYHAVGARPYTREWSFEPNFEDANCETLIIPTSALPTGIVTIGYYVVPLLQIETFEREFDSAGIWGFQEAGRVTLRDESVCLFATILYLPTQTLADITRIVGRPDVDVVAVMRSGDGRRLAVVVDGMVYYVLTATGTDSSGRVQFFQWEQMNSQEDPTSQWEEISPP
jgi:hypothetical protein